jgi:subfamily B ATP-binding cassette protein MsbA
MREVFAFLGLPFVPLNVIFVIVLVFALRGVLVFIGRGYHFRIHTELIGKIMAALSDALSRMSYFEYLKYSAGHFSHLTTREVNKCVMAYYQVSILIPLSISALTYVLLSLRADWRFASLGALFGGVTVLLFRAINRKTAVASRSMSHAESKMSSLVVQMMQSFKYLYSTASVGPLREKIKGTSSVVAETGARIGYLAAILPSSSETIIVMFMGTMIYLQTEVFGGRIDVLLIAMLFLYRAMREVNVMQGSWQTFNSYIGGVDAVLGSIATFNASAERAGGRSISAIERGIRLENVSFGYGEKRIIDGVNLDIKANSMVALVGESGAGKSTMVDLLTGLMAPSSGELLVDGIPYRELDKSSLRRITGYVTQEGVMFDDTVANNVSLWRWQIEPDGEAKLHSALERANCTSFVSQLPKGVEELLGERGLRLSGGQRQRLAIARELYKRPSLLILDEATSALDSESEKVVQGSIDRLKGTATIVLIAHRLSTIKNCDRIFLIKDGRIAAQGTFEDLVRNDETFRRMASAQGLN